MPRSKDLKKRVTPRQHRFCIAYIESLNASDAALKSGMSNTGYGRQLLSKPHIAEYIQQLKEKIDKKAEISVVSVLEDIVRRGRKAEEAGQFGPAMKSSELLAKHLGMLIERQETAGIVKIIIERGDG